MLREYGEERFADRIAGEIVRRRGRAELTTTFELNDAITAAIPAPARFAGGHPAKRTFQAIRIAVNGELAAARRGAPARVGRPEGRRPARGALLPLARGPARQALPRRAGPRLHLPARPSRLRAAATRRRRSSSTAARSCRRRARSRPTRDRSRLACGPPASSGRSADMPEHATATRPRDRPGAPAPGLRPGRAGRCPPARRVPRGRTGAFERLAPDPGPPRRRPPAAQPRVHLGDRDHARRDRRDAGLAAAANSGISRAVQTPEHARAPELRPCRPRSPSSTVRRAPARDGRRADR